MPDNQDVKIAELSTKLDFIQRDLESLKVGMGTMGEKQNNIKDKLEQNSDKIFNEMLKTWKDTEKKFITRNEFKIWLVTAQIIVGIAIFVINRFILK